MRPNEYKKRRAHAGELRTPVKFYEYEPREGPEPGQDVKKLVYECWAKVEQVWLKDLEQAKQNNTISDITLTIRDPLNEFMATNKHFIEIEAFGYEGYVYNVKSTRPDLQHRDFITIVGELKDSQKWA